MAQHKVPAFLSGLPKEEKEELMQEWISIKNKRTMKLLQQYVEAQRDRGVKQLYDLSPVSWFQSRYRQAAAAAEHKMHNWFLSLIQ
jgi:hypothetical protein